MGKLVTSFCGWFKNQKGCGEKAMLGRGLWGVKKFQSTIPSSLRTKEKSGGWLHKLDSSQLRRAMEAFQ